jgi:pimeloyl-ACP methyl ester carboxylesterase
MKHLVGSAVLAAWAASSVATAQVPEAIPSAVYTAPARLVDIGGGRRLNLFCQGHGPVVLMETGFSDTTMTWRKVQAQIATFATACSYDRAGLGFSDPGDHPSDLVNNAKDLERLIKAAGLGKPVLVGHSLGGLYVGYYARTHPGQVAGLVLVDPSIFGQRDLYLKLLGPEAMAKRDASRLEQVARYRHCLDLAKAGQLVPGRAVGRAVPGRSAAGGSHPARRDRPPTGPRPDPGGDLVGRPQLRRRDADLAKGRRGPVERRPALAADLPVILLKRPIAKPAAMDQAAFDGLIADANARLALAGAGARAAGS